MRNNYHTHTIFCDGSDTAEDMVLAAIERGCSEIGFSGHSYLPFDPSWTMTPENARYYRKVVSELRDRYADRIKIFLGVEQDSCADVSELSLYDYVIGGVHCIFKDGNYVSVDASFESQKNGIDSFYGGDRMAFVEDYFDEVGRLYELTKCQIIAHFDLLMKYSYFDVNDERYIKAEKSALERLIETPAVFELNTGAIYRDGCKDPYPSERVLEFLGRAGAPVVFSSDAHCKEALLFGFDELESLAKKHGLKVVDSMTELIRR